MRALVEAAVTNHIGIAERCLTGPARKLDEQT
jgi:hypothetical protein